MTASLRTLLAVGLTAAGLVTAAAVPPAAAASPATVGSVVVVGVPGLRWDDVSPTSTPALWSLAERSSLAAMSVKSVAAATCPADGWLVVGAGQRAAVGAPPRPAEPPPDFLAPTCQEVPAVTPTAGGGGSVRGMADVVATADADIYQAQVGLLAAQLEAGGVCATAVGDGAALALADRSGRVARYAPPGSALRGTDLLSACPLTVVDAGAVTETGFTQLAPRAPRQEQVAAADARLQQVLDAAPASATVLLTGAGDSATADPHLSVMLVAGPAYGDAWLTTTSTRRLGLTQLTDVLPTILELLGLEQPAAAVGQPVRAASERPALGAAVSELRDLDTAAQVADGSRAGFFGVFVGSQVVLYAAAAIALRRRWPLLRRLRVLRATRVAALAFGAIPVSTFLAQLVPWWRQDHPVPVLLAGIVTAIALVTAVAAFGPWRRDLLASMGVVAVTTAVVLGADIVTGSRLQLSSLMGYSPLVAGRFYGFGNVPFALFAASSIIGAAVLAQPLVRRGRRGAAGLLAGAVGVVAVAVDGVWGADFGGVIALVPGFALLAMGLAGIRVTLRRLALVLALALATITALAVVDWTRPTPTHLGRFVQQVIDGDALTVVQRKLDANISIFFINPWLSSLVPLGVAFLVLVLMRPLQWRAAALELAYQRAPALRPAVVATSAALVVGFAVNDSGIAVPAVGLTVAVPLTLAACVTALVREETEGLSGPPSPAPAAAGPAPATG